MFPRVGTPHIFNFQLSNGLIRTICGKNINKENTLTTISGDAVFPGICSICSHQIDEMYQDDLKEDPRFSRNSWQTRLKHIRNHHYCEILGPAGFAYEMSKRSWNKLNRAKQKSKKK